MNRKVWELIYIFEHYNCDAWVHTTRYVGVCHLVTCNKCTLKSTSILTCSLWHFIVVSMVMWWVFWEFHYFCYSHIQHLSVLLLASPSVFQAYCILKQRPSWRCCVFSPLRLGWMADFLAWFLLLVFDRGIYNLPLHFLMRKTHVFKSQRGN